MQEIIFGIGGLLLGGIGVFLTIRFRSHVQLSFIKHENFSLFNKIVKNLDNIDINFKNQHISENIYFLQGSILNSGNKDISIKHINRNLKFLLEKIQKYFNIK